MAPPTPAAAVCIPAWRPDPDHLIAAVAAACAQEGVVVEVVVSVAHEEAAEVEAVLDRVAGPHVTLVGQPDGLGMVQHWNAAVAASSAPIVVVPGQDDVLRPGFLRKHLGVHHDPTVVLCASAAALVDDGGGSVRVRPGRVHTRSAVLAGREARRLTHPQLARIVLRNGNVVGAPSQVSFRRDAFEAVGGFSERFEHAADVDLWLRLVERGGAVLLHEVLGTRRVHAGAATRTHRREGAAARDRQRLAADHGGALDEEVLAQAAAARTRWSAADAVRSAIRGDLDAAAAHLADARTTAPRAVRPWWQHAREVLSGRNDDA